ncbi:MAG: hypothetical protein ABIE47_11685 [Pseudomonadota bacterium]|nr:hypothetical protein [Pseudomonadota bacterium]
MKELETILKTVSDGLKILAQGVNAIADKLEKFVDPRKEKDGKPQPEPKPDEHRAETSKKRTPQKAVKKSVSERKKRTAASDTVYEIIGSTKGPVDISVLVEKTGFQKKKIHNVLYRLKKQGKVETVSKGLYRKA